MTGKMYSFRVQSPRVIELLDAVADKSAFIRDAVTEKLRTGLAVISEAAAVLATETEAGEAHSAPLEDPAPPANPFAQTTTRNPDQEAQT